MPSIYHLNVLVPGTLEKLNSQDPWHVSPSLDTTHVYQRGTYFMPQQPDKEHCVEGVGPSCSSDYIIGSMTELKGAWIEPSVFLT